MLYIHAYRTNADPNGRILSSRGDKYNNIIRKLISGPLGQGLNKKKRKLTLMNFEKNNSKDYIYWDEPNELVDRLRLLVAETQDGHNFLGNETQEILDELTEAGYILRRA